MIRKAVVTAAAVTMSVSGMGALATFVGSGVAGAKAPVVTPITCDTTGSVAFASPGISEDGTVSSAAKTTATTTLTSSDPGCNNNVPVVTNITAKTTKCSVPLPDDNLPILGETAPKFSEPPGCTTDPKGKYYDLAWSFAGSGANTILAALKKGFAFNDSGVALTLIPTAGSAVDPSGACGGSTTSGFELSGTVKKTTATWSLLGCLTTDTGGTSGVFTTDLEAQVLATAGLTGDVSDVISATAVGSPSVLTIS
jgi:hypothetical protein